MKQIVLTALVVVGFVTLSQQAFAQSIKSEKQRKEAIESSLKNEADTKKTIENEKVKIGLESKASQKDLSKEAQLREEKLKREAEENRRKEGSAKSNALKNANSRSLQYESEGVNTNKNLKSSGKTHKAGIEANSSELAKRKAELEKLKKEGKLSEDEYKTALQKIEMMEEQKREQGQKPKLGTSDKR